MDYVQDYLKMGFKKIAFTDHCPEKEIIDTREHMRMGYEERIEYLESIRALKEKYKGQIEILTGYEIEYLPGQEENLKELKAETDILILGQHFVFDKDEKNLVILHDEKINDDELERYVGYLEKSLELGLPDIVAHPDLFMLAREKFAEKEEAASRRICEAAQKYNIPLEINLNNIFRRVFLDKVNKVVYELSKEEQYQKLNRVGYPNKDFWKVASEYDVKVVYGIDTHSRKQILLYNELVDLATKIIGQDTSDQLKFIKEM